MRGVFVVGQEQLVVAGFEGAHGGLAHPEVLRHALHPQSIGHDESVEAVFIA